MLSLKASSTVLYSHVHSPLSKCTHIGVIWQYLEYEPLSHLHMAYLKKKKNNHKLSKQIEALWAEEEQHRKRVWSEDACAVQSSVGTKVKSKHASGQPSAPSKHRRNHATCSSTLANHHAWRWWWCVCVGAIMCFVPQGLEVHSWRLNS